VDARAKALIAHFGLQPHPEGGWYRRLYASDTPTRLLRGTRPTVTSIVYLLTAGERSRWHRVASDELWHFYEGAPLTLLHAAPDWSHVEALRLQAGEAPCPMAAVPAHHWQAAASEGPYSLVGCSVAPGFDFADFTLLADDPAATAQLRARQPQWLSYV
jgi:hypothetical protein